MNARAFPSVCETITPALFPPAGAGAASSCSTLIGAMTRSIASSRDSSDRM
jgi:hypothetical protein